MEKLSYFAVLTVFLFGLAGIAQATTTTPKTGMNYVNVVSCEQVGNDIRISLSVNSAKYVLTSTTRNAGHGLRNYKLNCLSATRYRVEWTEVASIPTPASTSTPNSPITTPTVTSTPPVVTPPPTVPADTTAPEIVFSGRRVGAQLNMNVYAVDKKSQSPITKIEVYQQSVSTPIFTWEDPFATTKDIWKHFQNDNFTTTGTYGFYVKAYDKAGNVGTSITLVLPAEMNQLRVANSSLSWIYDNILMKNYNVKKNGLKKFFVYTGDSYKKSAMSVTAICYPILSDVNNFTCSYFQPAKLKAGGWAYIMAWDNKNKAFSLPVMPFSW